tara:strand:+ start:364 stop:975 length:612 start_codon:yes stop_codon:yes gene_type:complete
MKKIALLNLFVGLTISVGAQNVTDNLKNVLKADWLVGTWETKNNNGQLMSHVFQWKIQDEIMVKEYRNNDTLQSFAVISLDSQKNIANVHSYSGRRVSVGEIKSDGMKVIRTGIRAGEKLTDEQIETKIKSRVSLQLAGEKITKEDIPNLEEVLRSYYRANGRYYRYIYQKSGENKLIMTISHKNDSGEFAEGASRTYTRKKN